MTDLIEQTLVADEEAIFSGGLFFRIVEASNPVALILERDGAIGDAVAKNAPAGYQLGPVPETRRFRRVRITSPVGQLIKILVGDDPADVVGVNVEIDVGIKAGAEKFSLSSFSIGTSAQTLSEVPGVDKVVRGRLLRSPTTNTGTFWFDDTTAVIGTGFSLEPGDTQFFPLGHNRNALGPQDLSVISSAAAQQLQSIIFYDDV